MLQNIFLEQKSVIVSHKYLDGIMFCSHSYRVRSFLQKQQNFQFSVQTLWFQNSLVHWLGSLIDVKTEKPNGQLQTFRQLTFFWPKFHVGQNLRSPENIECFLICLLNDAFSISQLHSLDDISAAHMELVKERGIL